MLFRLLWKRVLGILKSEALGIWLFSIFCISLASCSVLILMFVKYDWTGSFWPSRVWSIASGWVWANCILVAIALVGLIWKTDFLGNLIDRNRTILSGAMAFSVGAAICLLFLLFFSIWTSYLPLSMWQGWIIRKEKIKLDSGYAYIVCDSKQSLSSDERPSPARLFENGIELGPGNSLHASIRATGGGRFSFWHTCIYFSTSDNTNPILNGRTYSVLAPPLVLSQKTKILVFFLLIMYVLPWQPAFKSFVDKFSHASLRISRPSSIHQSWLILFFIELLLGGAYLSAQAFFPGFNLPLQVNWNSNSPQFLAGGVGLFIIGIVAISIPKANRFLRSNGITAYLIPLQVWCLLVLIGMELLLRVTVYSLPLYNRRTNWFGYIPADGSVVVWAEEGYGITRYEGPASEIHTPFSGGDNIIFLGDSFTEGLRVPDNQKYPSIAETVLRQDGYQIDVHNFGRSGAVIPDFISWVNAYQALYHPKLTVIAMEPYSFLEAFQTDKSNYFVEKNSKIATVVHQMDDLTGSYQVSNELFPGSPFLTLSQYGEQRLTQWESQGGTSNGTTTPQTLDLNLARQQMDLLMKTMNGSPLVVILIPHAPYISGDQIMMDDPEHEKLKEFITRYYPQIPLVDPLPEFRSLALSGSLPMGYFNSPTPGWGHYNRQADIILGELVAKAIEKELK